MRDLTARQVLDEMKVGWNLGNTFDTWSGNGNYTDGHLEKGNPTPATYETGWGGAIVTPELVKMIKDIGFGAFRLPVTWAPHMDKDDNIDEVWMARVEEVVNYVLDEGLYCVLNVHHDSGHGGWLKADAENYPAISKKFIRLWEQVAARFEKYGERLVFEGYNEILDPHHNWGVSDPADIDAANKLNQDFVNVVRASGGNNAKRVLTVTTYAASGTASQPLDHFKAPVDTVADKLIVQVHSYIPAGFCWHNIPYDEETEIWEHDRKIGVLENLFADMNRRFVSKGYPVMVGEFSANNKNNTPHREAYARDYVSEAGKYGIVCFWWDVNMYKEQDTAGCGLIDRKLCEWMFPTIAKALVDAAK